MTWGFFFNSFFNYWNITALQCCVSFSCTTMRISCMYTYSPSLMSLPPTPSHRSRSSQSTELSSLCCSFQLAIYSIHGGVYVVTCQCCFLYLPHPLFIWVEKPRNPEGWEILRVIPWRWGRSQGDKGAGQAWLRSRLAMARGSQDLLGVPAILPGRLS